MMFQSRCPAKIKSIEQFTNYLVKPNLKSGKNVTNFTRVLVDFLHTARCTGPLKSVLDNVDRIRKFKGDFYFKLKGILETCLCNPISQSDLIPRDDKGSLQISTDLLKKNQKISEILRKEGNNFYKRKQIELALRCYTLACSFAETGSKCAALGYSNRSACFFESGMFERALQDIESFEQVAREWKDENDLKIAERLIERKEKCLQKLKDAHGNANGQVEFTENLFQILKQNQGIPAAESFVGICDAPDRGRHVRNTSNRVIEPGTLLILENPYAKVLLDHYSFGATHCCNCLKDLSGGGIPCDGCVFVLYCSRECASTHTVVHSKYECKMAHLLYELNLNRTVHLSLSILLTLGPEGLSNFMNNATEPSDVDRIVGFSKEGIYDSCNYETIYNLIYHNSTLSEKELILYCTDAVMITEILDSETDFFCGLPDDFKEYFASLLLLHQMNLPCNAHSLYKLDIADMSSLTEDEIRTATSNEIGAGAFSLLSMINHSCDPNVVRITLPKGVNAVFSLKAIHPGQEILDNYGVHFATHESRKRKSYLKETYNFECNCLACNDTYPLISELVERVDDESNVVCVDCLYGTNVLKIVRFQVCPSDKLWMGCPQCNKRFPVADFNQEFNLFVSQHESATNLLLKNKPVPAFSESAECLKFFDTRLCSPNKYISLTQEIMKQALVFIARPLFR